MTYTICERCQNSFKVESGYSQTKRIENTHDKCYVCSETNLHNAEVFKGVVFCASCAYRIFQSCDSVKKTKNQVTRGKKARLGTRRTSPVERKRYHQRRETSRPREKRLGKDVHRVIELCQQVRSSSDSSHSDTFKKCVRSSKTQITAGLALQVTKNVPYECCRVKSFKKESIELGITTDVTQELLNEINACFRRSSQEATHKKAIAPIPKAVSPMISRQKANENLEDKRHKPIYSDLRIAELGASTEIANMALRKKSEVPVIIQSDNELKTMKSYSDSFLNRSGKNEDIEVGLDSAYGSLKGSEIWVNHEDGWINNIMKMPIKFFKKNILNRSSLVSLIMSTKHKMGILRRIKNVFYEDLTEQQALGVKRLYSTINRRKIAYKLGWLHLASKVSRSICRQENRNGALKVGCKHYRTSDNYRCMRDQVMKLAGPTRSQLACIRKKIKGYVTAKCVRDVFKCLYIGNSQNIPEETLEHQTERQVISGIVQQSKEAVEELTVQTIPKTDHKPIRLLIQQSQPMLASTYKPVINRHTAPVINQQPYQQVPQQPIQQIVHKPVKQLIHQPHYCLQTVYQTKTNHNTGKLKEMDKGFARFTRVSC